MYVFIKKHHRVIYPPIKKTDCNTLMTSIKLLICTKIRLVVAADKICQDFTFLYIQKQQTRH